MAEHRTRTQYLVLSTNRLLILAIWFLAGCNRPSDAGPADDREPTFAEQVAAVRDGKTDRIQVEAAVLADDDLAALAGLESLRELLIDHGDSHITILGVKRLTHLPHLMHLRLRGPGIDDTALVEIAKLESLHILNVPQGDFSDAGLDDLKRLSHLEQLRFGSRQVTDAGMASLAEFPTLTRLHLIGVPITDKGLAELAKIERLESLYIDDSQITDAGWEELFRQRPQLHVHINQEHHDRDPHKHPH